MPRKLLRRVTRLMAAIMAALMIVLLPASLLIVLPESVGAQALDCSCLAPVIDLLQQILREDTLTANSVTTGGGGGLWQAQGGYLTQQNQTLNTGIFDAQKFAANFPGWLALPPTSTQDAKQISAVGLTTYAGAVAIAQGQAANFGNEDSELSSIAGTSSGSTAVLQAIQANTQAVLAVASQIQELREIELAHLDIDAVHHGEELNERAQAGATTAKSLNAGIAP
jgi:hypothetical protein